MGKLVSADEIIDAGRRLGAIKRQRKVHATTQLALLLTLSRSMPLLLGFSMQQRGVTLEQFEDRIILSML